MQSWVVILLLVAMVQGGPLGSIHMETQVKIEKPQIGRQPLKMIDVQRVDRTDDVDLLIKCHKEYIQTCCEGDHYKVPMYIHTEKGVEKCSAYARCCKL